MSGGGGGGGAVVGGGGGGELSYCVPLSTLWQGQLCTVMVIANLDQVLGGDRPHSHGIRQLNFS